ncbi:MAG: Glycosyltransferase AglJ [Candidatus Methanofastidiosum methylothiophilum]|uniref:Glycosyltransferase AglJ n=1 Tax=Candidatus Methanofastidiosum methylothiophilum TaxID=1705564 RepID=A0A150J8J9_9EURY|nr:MAG: Glycosyltransferase AglJ [Candidatus Methanofastidiosum methylthiophilus]
MSEVSVVIPTLNEEKTIGKVIDDCIKALNKVKINNNIDYKIIVVDGNSKDKTREIAKRKNAHIILEERKGKGIAIICAFKKINSDYLIMLDGDGTYNPKDISIFLDNLLNQDIDIVIGKRVPKDNSMTKLNRFGNYIINLLIRKLYKLDVHDICTGFWGFKKKVYKDFTKIEATGFDLEVLMAINSIKYNFKLLEIPTEYKRRIGDTNLSPFRDGALILGVIIRLLRDYNPIFLFGSLGIFFLLLGLYFGVRLIITFNEKGFLMIGHTLLTVLFILIAVQTIYFGLLSDLIIRKINGR